MATVSDLNDASAAKNSLDASLHHWSDGQPILCREWILKLLDDVIPLANEFDMVQLLAPIYSVLESGNQAMKFELPGAMSSWVKVIDTNIEARRGSQKKRLTNLFD